MTYISTGFNYLAFVVFILLFWQAFYLFIFALAAKLSPKKRYPESTNLGSFAIYIPSYKEDSVIVDTAKAALLIDYPVGKRSIIVIADSLKSSTLEELKLLPIQVVEAKFDKSTKAKALNLALQQTASSFDYALVLDADNVCAKDFLYQINNALQCGLQVVQGQRVAKNTNTAFALLDAISEGINNNIFRKGHTALGLSCAIIGSGMALNFELFKEIMPEITAIGGFDKEMELRLLKRKLRFGYAEHAIVYDEKTQHQAVFENQRRRWLSAQFHYMRRYIAEGFVQLTKGNVDFFDKVLQTLLLPRIIILGFAPFAFLISLFFGNAGHPIYWFVLWFFTYAGVLIAIPGEYFNKRICIALLSLPAAFMMMLKLFFKLKGANKVFLHTPHGAAK